MTVDEDVLLQNVLTGAVPLLTLGEVAGIVIIVIISLLGYAVLIVVGGIPELALGVVGIGPVILRDHICGPGDIPHVVIDIGVAAQAGAAPLPGGVELLGKGGGGFRAFAGGVGIVLGQNAAHIPLAQPGEGVIAIIQPGVGEEGHAQQDAVGIVIGIGFSGIAIIIIGLGRTVNDPGDGISEGLETAVCVIAIGSAQVDAARLAAAHEPAQGVIGIAVDGLGCAVFLVGHGVELAVAGVSVGRSG